MTTRLPRLIDERSRPDFRDLYGQLAGRSSAIDVALQRIRLSTLDLSERELGRVGLLRLLLSQVSAPALDSEVRSVRARPEREGCLRRILAAMEAGRIVVRASPLAGWSPDFSVFHGPSGPRHMLVGLHSFERPYPHPGPAFVAVVSGAAARLAADRFEEAWQAGHDVSPAVSQIVGHALATELPA